jgi:hypothetical protein
VVELVVELGYLQAGGSLIGDSSADLLRQAVVDGVAALLPLDKFVVQETAEMARVRHGIAPAFVLGGRDGTIRLGPGPPG